MLSAILFFNVVFNNIKIKFYKSTSYLQLSLNGMIYYEILKLLTREGFKPIDFT